MNEAPAGLYVHVPFCARICPYCDFAVRTGDRERRRSYVDHLLCEIELYRDQPTAFDTIYLGGGTPSALDPGQLGRLFDGLRRHLRFRADTRVFLEANPEDVTPERARAWRELGVGTLSLGLQSLDSDNLRFLGRTHGVRDGERAVQTAREAGFETVSIDLIYGLPGQSVAAWGTEIDRALALEPDHLSCYALTIKPRTRFGSLAMRGRLSPMPDDDQAELFRLVHRRLADAGYPGYEVSNFARSEAHRSRHNLKYWQHTPYLGLGPSAHSFHGDRRWWNLRNTGPWQERIDRGQRPVEEQETLDPRSLALESLMLGLRTYDGVDLAGLRNRWGIDLAALNAALIDRLRTAGILSLEGSRLVPSLDGLAVADALAAEFDLGPPPGRTMPPSAPAGDRDDRAR